MVIAATGHRPNKLWGYNYNHPKYIELKRTIRNYLIDNECTEGVSGMALGLDTIFALAVIELKEAGYDIKLHCAIPCKNQDSKWLDSSKQLYKEILSKADEITYVTENEYTPNCMQLRNEYMVDICDKLFALWDGSNGGTKNCVEYALGVGKEIDIFSPQNI